MCVYKFIMQIARKFGKKRCNTFTGYNVNSELAGSLKNDFNTPFGFSTMSLA